MDLSKRLYRLLSPRTVRASSDGDGSRAPPLRIGILGAAAIAPIALIAPARLLPDDVVVTMVAARDPIRALAYAKKHGIPHVANSYEELVTHPDIDVVYNPLPNSLHAVWTIAAINAGKHVLCEKPFASNCAEAVRVYETLLEKNMAIRTADPDGKLLHVYDAFHWRAHPLARRLRELLPKDAAAGPLGRPIAVDIEQHIMWWALNKNKDIRYNFGLSGGCTMDFGCYAVNAAAFVFNDICHERVISAEADAFKGDARIDEEMRCKIDFGDDRTASIRVGFKGGWLPRSPRLIIECEKGRIEVLNYIAPFIWHELRITRNATDPVTDATTAPSVAIEQHYADGNTTYYYQLREFARAIQSDDPSSVIPDARNAANVMAIVDDVYRTAGLPVRVSSLPPPAVGR